MYILIKIGLLVLCEYKYKCKNCDLVCGLKAISRFFYFFSIHYEFL